MMRNKNTLQKSEQTVLLINFSLRYLHLEEFCIITIQRRNPLNFYLNYGIKMITLVSFTSLSKMSGTWLNSFLMGGTFGVLCVSLSGHLCYQPLTVSAISHFVFASKSETQHKNNHFTDANCISRIVFLFNCFASQHLAFQIKTKCDLFLFTLIYSRWEILHVRSLFIN